MGNLHADQAGGLDQFLDRKDVEIWVHDKECWGTTCEMLNTSNCAFVRAVVYVLANSILQARQS
jgi:hypothetical protein